MFEFAVDMVPPKLHKNSNAYPFKVNNNFIMIDQLSIKKTAAINLCAVIKFFKIKKVVRSKKAKRLIYTIKLNVHDRIDHSNNA